MSHSSSLCSVRPVCIPAGGLRLNTCRRTTEHLFACQFSELARSHNCAVVTSWAHLWPRAQPQKQRQTQTCILEQRMMDLDPQYSVLSFQLFYLDMVIFKEWDDAFLVCFVEEGPSEPFHCIRIQRWFTLEAELMLLCLCVETHSYMRLDVGRVWGSLECTMQKFCSST